MQYRHALPTEWRMENHLEGRLRAAFSLPAAEDDAAGGQVVGDPVVVESLNDRFLTTLRAVGIRSFQRTGSGVGCTA